MRQVFPRTTKLHLNLAWIKKAGARFEIDIDPDLAIAFREGKQIDILEVLKAERVFSDAHKGLGASEHKMQEAFGTTDPLAVARIILKEGEIQVNAQHRELLLEQKKKRILEYLHRHGVDPKTGYPHPIGRIERALEEAKFKISEKETEEWQIHECIHKLKAILPIRFETKSVELTFDPEFAPKARSAIEKFGSIKKDTWNSDGSWTVVLEMPAGMLADCVEAANKIAHGKVMSRNL